MNYYFILLCFIFLPIFPSISFVETMTAGTPVSFNILKGKSSYRLLYSFSHFDYLSNSNEKNIIFYLYYISRTVKIISGCFSDGRKYKKPNLHTQF